MWSELRAGDVISGHDTLSVYILLTDPFGTDHSAFLLAVGGSFDGVAHLSIEDHGTVEDDGFTVFRGGE